MQLAILQPRHRPAHLPDHSWQCRCCGDIDATGLYGLYEHQWLCEVCEARSVPHRRAERRRLIAAWLELGAEVFAKLGGCLVRRKRPERDDSHLQVLLFGRAA